MRARRWLVATAAALAGTAVAAALLLYPGPDAAGDQFLVVATDLPAGATLARDSIRVERLRLGDAARLAFTRGAEAGLVGRRASHDLAAGQVLQRVDLLPVGNARDRRLVWIPARDLPPLSAGDLIDLLELTGSGDHLVVQPFALGIEVWSATANGVVVAVSSRQAAGFVYAAATGRLVAVAGPPGSPPGEEVPVGSLLEAEASVR